MKKTFYIQSLVNQAWRLSQGIVVLKYINNMEMIDPSTYYIYVTTDLTNNKQYVGYHKLSSATNYKGSGTTLKQAIKEKGTMNFTTHIIDWYGTQDDALMAETYYVYNYETYEPNGYNNIHSLKNIDKTYEWLQKQIIKKLSR